jgi:phage-related protein
MTALILTDKISQSSQAGREYRVTKIKFGNGYEQRAKDGINNIVDSWSLTWDNLSQTDMNSLSAFFDSLGGTTYFTWQAPTDSASKKWTVSKWTASVLAGTRYSVNVSIEQIYDL